MQAPSKPCYLASKHSSIVSILRGLPSPAFLYDLTAWTRVAVRYADSATAMPLVRINRRGLTVTLGKGAKAPTIGLPRQAFIVGDAVPFG